MPYGGRFPNIVIKMAAGLLCSCEQAKSQLLVEPKVDYFAPPVVFAPQVMTCGVDLS